MLAGGKRLSPTEPTGETGGLRSNSDEVEMNNDCYAIYTSPPPAAEPLLKEKPLERHFNRMNLSAVLKSADKKCR